MTVSNGIEDMTKREIKTIEFKQSLAETGKIIETVCAFANTKGGVKGIFEDMPRQPYNFVSILYSISSPIHVIVWILHPPC